MKLTWPCAKNGKPQFIEYSSKSVKLLVPAGNYVLLRRFSAKEDKHRLIAAPINREHVKGVYIGIENHLNYIWQPRGKMSEAEAWGLAGIFNSGFYERYFRAINGNTQVNASEIRSMPLPPIQIIRNIGEQILQLLPAHDKILMFVRSLDQILAPRLEEGENEKT
jgi:adenine-specific DNA-methyltransferase